MKASTVGLVLGAILMVVAGVGFGIAQAGGNHTEGPVLSFEDQEAFEQSDSSSTLVRVPPSGIDLSYDADGNPSTDMADLADGTYSRGAVEAGRLPVESNDSSVKYEIIDGVTWYRVEGKLYELYGP